MLIPKFITAYLPTILVAALVVAVITLVVIKMVRDKKNHKSSCGCNCSDCPSAGMCHPK